MFIQDSEKIFSESTPKKETGPCPLPHLLGLPPPTPTPIDLCTSVSSPLPLPVPCNLLKERITNRERPNTTIHTCLHHPERKFFHGRQHYVPKNGILFRGCKSMGFLLDAGHQTLSELSSVPMCCPQEMGQKGKIKTFFFLPIRAL